MPVAPFLLLLLSARPVQAPDRAAILAAVDRHFAGMKARDTAMMASVSHPGATTAAVSYQDGRARVRGGLTAAGRARVAASSEAANEWLLAAEVWQDGDVAAVWAPYEIWLGGRLLHCGYDGYNMVRDEGRWQIAGTVYTARPDACPALRVVAAGPLPLPPPSPEERQAVMAVVDSFFATMRRKDTTRLAALFTPRASWVVAAYREGQVTIRRRPASGDPAMVARATETLDERLFDPVVRVDGDVALVWGPYQFRVGERVSHCGHDAFHLVREGGVWRIEGGAYTVRPDGCTRFIRPRQVDPPPATTADATVAYGPDPRQVGELGRVRRLLERQVP